MRLRGYLLPVLALAGVGVAAVAIVLQNQPVPGAAPAVASPASPFATYVAATGTIEASSGNIAVGTPVSGIVTAIYVKWGDAVRAGDPLFKVDDRALQAQLLPALAGVKTARARLDQARRQLEIANQVPDPRALSVEELTNRRSAVETAAAAVAVSEAEIRRIRLEIQRCTVRALVPGRILQIFVRPGEFAAGGGGSPLMLLGSEVPLYVRVNVDQYDAARVRRGAPAVAFLRGDPASRTALRFERIEPYVVPKTALTGTSTEQVDTRVLPVIFSFDPASLPTAFVGQQMDVFIEAPPLSARRSDTTATTSPQAERTP